jgi:hypothetical protein
VTKHPVITSRVAMHCIEEWKIGNFMENKSVKALGRNIAFENNASHDYGSNMKTPSLERVCFKLEFIIVSRDVVLVTCIAFIH